jgi:membrane glycosyltransferase
LLPRRLTFLGLVLALAAGLVALGWQVLAPGGWTVWEAAILLCLVANAPWLALSAATALVGLAIRLISRDPAGVVLPALRRASPTIHGRTVITACVRLEEMAAVLPPLEALLRDLRARPDGHLFSLAILSDTPEGEAAGREEEAVAALGRHLPTGAVLYRRRTHNTGYKAGNLMDFLDAEGSGFDFALVLDADSAMSAEAVLRLVGVMEAEPGTAIVQPTVAGRAADTVFARLFGLGHRQGARVWATGQAWWQGPQGPFWGHNALIRVAAFREHARLPAMPDGSHILSHDHVEAALLQGGGWAVRVLPDDAGSAERHPPDLPAMFDRDLRWAAGNMQYLQLLRRQELGALGRFQMLQAALHYLLTPLFLAPLPLAAVNAATGGAEGTPRGLLVALLLACFATLHLPKLAGYLELLLRGKDRPALREVLAELVLGVLLDSIAAFDRTVTLARLLLGAGRGWSPQARDGRRLRWREAARRFAPHAGVGLVLAVLFGFAGAFALLAAFPFLAGLLLAVPLAVLTSRPAVRSSRAHAPAAGAAPRRPPAPAAAPPSAPAERRI